MTKIGDVVLAIKSVEGDTVYLYGVGKYVGEDHPPVGPFGIKWTDEFSELKSKYTNPKIILDNGKIVWGLQSWWGSPESMQKYILNKNIVIVDSELEIQNLLNQQ